MKLDIEKLKNLFKKDRPEAEAAPAADAPRRKVKLQIIIPAVIVVLGAVAYLASYYLFKGAPETEPVKKAAAPKPATPKTVPAPAAPAKSGESRPPAVPAQPPAKPAEAKPGPNPPVPPVAPAPAPTPAKPVEAAPAKPAEAAPAAANPIPFYEYSGGGRRDPFTALIVKTEPEKKKGLTPMESFEASELKVIAILWNKAGYYAMITLPDGKSYTVREGTKLGLHGGKVYKITRDSVIIREQIRDYKGMTKSKDTILKLRGEEQG